MVYKNSDLLKDIEFEIHCKDFFDEEYGKDEEIIPKIILILKNCKKPKLNSLFNFNYRFPNFIEKISKGERKELYQLLNYNGPIKKKNY